MTKSFLVLLALVLAWGVSIGGAFAGGVALGKGQPSNGPEEASGGRAEASAGPSEGAIQGQTVQAAQPIPGQGRRSPAAGGRGPGGRGVTGDIEKVEGDVITIDTPRGPVLVAVGDDTTVSKVTDSGREELTEGNRVRVLGQRGPDGTVAARAILITSAGAEGFFGGDPGRGNAPFRDRSGQ